MQIHRSWTEEDCAIMRKEYPSIGAKGLVEKLGRKRAAINKQAQTMGIRYVPSRTYVTADGYVESYEIVGNRQYRRFLVHHEKMEKKLGRKLERYEVVHHRNGDRQDNRLSNLVVLTRTQHIEKHRPELLRAQRAKSKI